MGVDPLDWIPSFELSQVSDFVLKKGREHAGRLEKAQEDSLVHNKEKDAELPETHQEPQHHGEPSACRGRRVPGQEAGPVLFAFDRDTKSRTTESS